MGKKWFTDLALLVKYWKSQGYSKKQVKEWCIDKCVKYVKNFNPIKDGPDLKKSIDNLSLEYQQQREENLKTIAASGQQ